MSAVAVAPLAVPLRTRRALREVFMTPEEELRQLVAEQEKDDTPWIDRPPHVVSLDAPTPDGKTIEDHLGTDEDGEPAFYGSWGFRRGYILRNPEDIPHGTLGGYNNHRCRCIPCRGAISSYRAQRRAEQ